MDVVERDTLFFSVRENGRQHDREDDNGDNAAGDGDDFLFVLGEELFYVFFELLKVHGIFLLFLFKFVRRRCWYSTR